jgi:hypothetical protein
MNVADNIERISRMARGGSDARAIARGLGLHIRYVHGVLVGLGLEAGAYSHDALFAEFQHGKRDALEWRKS